VGRSSDGGCGGPMVAQAESTAGAQTATHRISEERLIRLKPD
jgi:hypothetical protein